MALFPQTFLDDLKTQTDIVAVVGDVVALRKAGAAWKGLCPFHQEKTPSFTVHRDKGFFKCFGCGAGGDAVTFVELSQNVAFPEAVRILAKRAGMEVPESGPSETREAAALRESLLAVHEQVALFYREQLDTPAGAVARREIAGRGLRPSTSETFGYGYAPSGRDVLHRWLSARGVPTETQVTSGLVVQRDDGRLQDRFRHRLIIPIARETGAVVAFGGRALDAGQVPKYLNSPETPIYTKGRTVYGLHVTRDAIRKFDYCVLVEGYFDLAQVWQAGILPVVASSGTALTPVQARLLKRLTSKIVLNFDPDAAGQGAAARSSELLVAEGFQVNVLVLPDGADPDSYIRKAGGRAYTDRLTGSRPYLDFLIDRAAARLDVRRADSRKAFIDQMLTVAATIPDAAARDQFADRIAHKARITESVIRDEIRRAAAKRQTRAPAVAVDPGVTLRPAEQGLLWALVHRPVEGLAAVAQLEEADLEGLVTAPILTLARSLGQMPPDVLPALLGERLSPAERGWLDRAAAAPASAAPPTDCVNALRRLRYQRERMAVQDEIDRLQPTGDPDDDERLTVLWERKKALLQRLEDLNA